MFTKLVVIKLVCALVILNSFVDSYRILVVFPHVARSHFILGNAFAKGLAEAGHHVTMLSPFSDKNAVIKNKNGSYEEIVLTGFLEEKEKKPMNMFSPMMSWPILKPPALSFMTNQMVIQTLEHPNFKKLLASDEHYDAVVVEQFNLEALKILAYHFKAPLILFSTVGVNSWVSSLVGNPDSPSYMSDVFLDYSPPFSFFERVKNFLFRIYGNLVRDLYSHRIQSKVLKQAYPNAPDFDTLLYNVSLVLLNSHESTNQAVPHVPNMIDIGGYHIGEVKPLPTDLQDFMDNAKNGVIYFSLGSNIVPSTMPRETRETLLRTLGQMKQNVLWKWDEENLPNKPNNLKISKWFPQTDILAHPNCKLFITHGGLLSTFETVHTGVPILALPVFGDQSLNAARAQSAGYGISLPFAEITEERLSENLKEIFENPKYRENAKRRSAIMHDRITKPMDTAVFWVEYVIRHKGAPHLRVAAVDLPLYQYILLDVIGFLIVVSLGSIFVLRFIFKKLCCRSRGRGSEKLKKN